MFPWHLRAPHQKHHGLSRLIILVLQFTLTLDRGLQPHGQNTGNLDHSQGLERGLLRLAKEEEEETSIALVLETEVATQILVVSGVAQGVQDVENTATHLHHDHEHPLGAPPASEKTGDASAASLARAPPSGRGHLHRAQRIAPPTPQMTSMTDALIFARTDTTATGTIGGAAPLATAAAGHKAERRRAVRLRVSDVARWRGMSLGGGRACRLWMWRG